MQRIEPAILGLPVCGLNLRAGTLGQLIAAPATLVVFLRHLGCMFCREMVADLREAAGHAPFPPVLLITQSPPDEAAVFFADRWPEVAVVTDPDRRLYTAFNITRAHFGGLFGPAVWTCSVRALSKGHRQNLAHTLRPPSGDAWLLSALFLIGPGGAIHWEQRARHAGERADLDAVPRPGRSTPKNPSDGGASHPWNTTPA